MIVVNNKVEIESFKKEIRDSGYEKHETQNKEILYGTMYIKDKMDYGFHLYFIHEPSETDSIAGKSGIVSEMFYDLRNKVFWIKRNMKEVNFSVRNIDSIFPSGDKIKLFDMLSTTANQGLYSAALKYLGAMGEERSELFGRFFYRLITKHSYFEIMHKAGIKINETTRIANPNGKSPMEIMGLSKTQWKMISKYNIRTDAFQTIRNDVADEKMINYLSYVRSLEEEFGLERAVIFFATEFYALYKQQTTRAALLIAERYNLPIKNLIKYIYFECDVSQGLTASVALEQYSDYIRMTTEMGYERFDRYPKFLRTAHDIASRNYKVKLTASELEEWKASYENNKHFEYAYQGYKIFPPKDPSDLIKEGNVLGHCVGSYVNKVRKGISAILFLRERDDVDAPLVTIEVVNNRISQARGKMNNPPNKEQSEIIKKFAKKFELAN